MMRLRLRRRDLVCQQAVELVTDYLEGALSRATGAGTRRTWRAARTAPSTWPRCARPSADRHGHPRGPDPADADEFIDLYRQWHDPEPSPRLDLPRDVCPLGAAAHAAGGGGHASRVPSGPGLAPESVWHCPQGQGRDAACACRRNHDGGWAHSAAIACQVHPAPRRLAT